MRPRINEFLLSTFDSSLILYLIPSSITLYFIAVSVALWLFLVRCDRSSLNDRNVVVGALLAIIAGLLGARTYYLLHHYQYVRQHTESMFRCTAGLASWGAYVGGLLVFVSYLRIKREDLLKRMDVLASVLGLGPFFIRGSCFLNGCCYGTPTDLPWAVRYPLNSFAYRSHLQAGLVFPGEVYSLPVHPVQLYLSFFGLFNLVAASFFWGRFKKYPGTTFLFYWLVYGIGRFLLEFIRGDVPRYSGLRLSLSQIVILMVLCAVSAGSWMLFRNLTKAWAKTSI